MYIAIWAYLAPPDDKPIKRPDSPDTTLEELVTKPERYDGKTVNVRGVFRGENLFGDLPSASRDRSSDWVMKDDVFAVWVSGKKPKGSGWSLDASLKRDTGKWLQIMGPVRVRKGVVTLEAAVQRLDRLLRVRLHILQRPQRRPRLVRIDHRRRLVQHYASSWSSWDC